MRSLYILNITPYQTNHLQGSFLFQSVAFSFCRFVFLCQSFLVGCGPICLFLVLLPLPEDADQKNIAKTNPKECTADIFF